MKLRNITPLANKLGLINPDDVLTHIACGGSLEDYARQLEIRFADLWRYLTGLPDWEKQYDLALKTSEARDKDLVLRSLRAIVTTYPSDCFNEDGTMKPVSEWPKDLIAGFETEELLSHDKETMGEVLGTVKKVKAIDRLKALEMLGKERGMFQVKGKVEHTMTLEQIVEQSNRIQPSDKDIQQ